MTVTGDPDTDDNATFLTAWNGHGDALGLWRQNADGSVTLANSFTYTTWGASTTTVASPFSDLGFRYLYVGLADVQSDNAFGLGLLYMHARHYAPALGRFLQPDPSRADTSTYRYARNSPATLDDPSGLLPGWDAMNSLERGRCANRPYECIVWALASKFSIMVSESTYPNETVDGRGDALRHCTWQCALTSVLGRNAAQAWAQVHENGDPHNNPLSRRMDEWNNRVGQALAGEIAHIYSNNLFVDPGTLFSASAYFCAYELAHGYLRIIRGHGITRLMVRSHA